MATIPKHMQNLVFGFEKSQILHVFRYIGCGGTMFYEKLLCGDDNVVAESGAKYFFITERHVQVMWLQQKYFRQLVTSDGEVIEVISPGIWNAEGGPDFKKAHIRIAGKEYRGDVEVHLRDAGWVQHKHHMDRSYNEVVLHLSFWKSSMPKEIVDTTRRTIPRAYFENSLTIPLSRILQLIDLELYPYKRFSGSGRCAEELFKKLDKESIERFFVEASLYRLEKKERHLTLRSENRQLQTAVGIAMALGYRDNAEHFVELLHHLIPNKKAEESVLFASSLRLFNFFSDHFIQKWGDSPYYRQLAETKPLRAMATLPPLSIQLQKIRPINHPVRRLVYLVKLVKDPLLPMISEQIAAKWQRRWPQLTDEKKTRKFIQELASILPNYCDSYWNHHYTFEESPKEAFLPLIGDALKREIVVNTFFPLLFSSTVKKGPPAEHNAFLRLYSHLKSTATRKSRYLKHRFFGESSHGILLERSDIVQGAYQLHNDFCVHHEASCEGCPFVKRYTTLYSSKRC